MGEIVVRKTEFLRRATVGSEREVTSRKGNRQEREKETIQKSQRTSKKGGGRR